MCFVRKLLFLAAALLFCNIQPVCAQLHNNIGYIDCAREIPRIPSSNLHTLSVLFEKNNFKFFNDKEISWTRCCGPDAFLIPLEDKPAPNKILLFNEGCRCLYIRPKLNIANMITHNGTYNVVFMVRENEYDSDPNKVIAKEALVPGKTTKLCLTKADFSNYSSGNIVIEFEPNVFPGDIVVEPEH